MSTGDGPRGTRGARDHRRPPGGEREGPTFAEPWQARAFALAVALTDEGERDRNWDGFRRELVAELDRSAGAGGGTEAGDEVDGDEGDYYGAWLAALERFLTERGVIDAEAFAERAAEFADGDRDAHEFVEGDPRAHADRLPEGHADGSDHRGHDHSH
ncbi:nitrile hydratase accessory protein [Halorarum salinum]|uniref:Nitrile hydratase accessory protein n=1 Tax=Halorarum salinum TaxID=2743089 RepID=A0A7D5L9P4_9EURY|nr:nitrile hydratase accessory protein [Halobaculum salinum]QLG61606.1 nitrile hydratase accessory protein [Halobaculum salinum]